jgi:hypothetical protein
MFLTITETKYNYYYNYDAKEYENLEDIKRKFIDSYFYLKDKFKKYNKPCFYYIIRKVGDNIEIYFGSGSELELEMVDYDIYTLLRILKYKPFILSQFYLWFNDKHKIIDHVLCDPIISPFILFENLKESQTKKIFYLQILK